MNKKIIETKGFNEVKNILEKEKIYRNVVGGKNYFEIYGNDWVITIDKDTGEFLEKPRKKDDMEFI